MLLWPKLLCFVIVIVTHYQFLRYLALTFLPGKRQLCALSAFLQPKEFAEILTQKQLRDYTLIVAKQLTRRS